MAKVWFVRREGDKWVAPGGQPAYELPLSELVFPLDLGPQRRLVDGRPESEPALASQDPQRLTKVIVETGERDLVGLEFTWFKIGFYDSPYSPAEVKRRIESLPAAKHPPART